MLVAWRRLMLPHVARDWSSGQLLRYEGCMTYRVAILGATGAVGREMLRVLEQREFPIRDLRLLASPRSAGELLTFRGKEHQVRAVDAVGFDGVDLALFSAGAGPSRVFVPVAESFGAWVVDNSSAWRMSDDVALVVPEVNQEAPAKFQRRIIANPNCVAIPLTVALQPLHQAFGLKRLVVSTYQAASGKGQHAVEELRADTERVLRGEPAAPAVFPRSLAFDVLSDWRAEDHFRSEEEAKVVAETRKILGLPGMPVTATCIRVPVLNGHAASVMAEFERQVDLEEVEERWAHAPGLRHVTGPYAPGAGPSPSQATGGDDVLVGRLRAELGSPHALHFFLASDNLRKGAALNAVQIAEALHTQGRLGQR